MLCKAQPSPTMIHGFSFYFQQKPKSLQGPIKWSPFMSLAYPLLTAPYSQYCSHSPHSNPCCSQKMPSSPENSQIQTGENEGKLNLPAPLHLSLTEFNHIDLRRTVATSFLLLFKYYMSLSANLVEKGFGDLSFQLIQVGKLENHHSC